MTNPAHKNPSLARRLIWGAIILAALSPLLPFALKTLAEQSEFRGQMAQAQASVVEHYLKGGGQ